MMRQQFVEELERLAAVFRRPANIDILADELMRRYVAIPFPIWRQAVTWLIDNFDKVGFPPPKMFGVAVATARSESNMPTDPSCSRCGGNGMIPATITYKVGDEYREGEGVTPCPQCNQWCKLTPSKIEMQARPVQEASGGGNL